MAVRQRIIRLLAASLAVDAAFNAVAFYDLAPSTPWGAWARDWAERDMDRLRFPERLRFLFPIIKSAAVLGLVAGLRWRALGRLTAASLVAYFLTALGFHARARDSLAKSAPAAAMLAWSALALALAQ